MMLSYCLNVSAGPRSNRLAKLVATAIGVAASVSSAHAAVAVTNLNNADLGLGLFMFAPDGYRATSFTTGNTAETIGSLDVRIANRAGLGSTEAYIASVYTNAGGIPGALVGSFNTLNFTQTIPNYLENATFSTAGISVSANTTYWLVMGVPGSSAGADWLGSQIADETSSMGWTIGNNALVYAGGGGPGWIVNGGGPGRFTINLIPAPGAAALLALGGLVTTRRRR